MEELKLFYFPACPFCKKVVKFLKRNNLEKEITLKNINKDQDAKKELNEKGGKNQVPCLFINNEPLYESNDIIKWLKENKLS